MAKALRKKVFKKCWCGWPPVVAYLYESKNEALNNGNWDFLVGPIPVRVTIEELPVKAKKVKTNE